MASTVLFTIIQYAYKYQRYVSFRKAAKESFAYKEEQRKLERKKKKQKEEQDKEEIEIFVEGAEKPTIFDLLVVQILLFPYFIYKCCENRRKRLEFEKEYREKFKEYYDNLSSEERKKFLRKMRKNYVKRNNH